MTDHVLEIGARLDDAWRIRNDLDESGLTATGAEKARIEQAERRADAVIGHLEAAISEAQATSLEGAAIQLRIARTLAEYALVAAVEDGTISTSHKAIFHGCFESALAALSAQIGKPLDELPGGSQYGLYLSTLDHSTAALSALLEDHRRVSQEHVMETAP